ncbi:MAG: metallophosphoesterase family protein [Candidatus Spyradosoma sp.]
MDRRHFLASLGLFGAGAALAPAGTLAPAAAKDVPAAGDDAFLAFPVYAQFTGADTADVRWRTGVPAVSRVEWTQDAALPREKRANARPSRDGMIAAGEIDHCVTLRGLDPAKPLIFEAFSAPVEKIAPYEIRLGAERSCGVRTLRPVLADGDALSLAVFNDLHGRIDLIPKLLSRPEVRDAAPALALFNGDCLDDCDTRAAVEKRFLRALPPLTEAGRSALFLRGNHEYRGAAARSLRAHLSPLAGGNYFGAFTLGPVRFLCVDSGEDKPDAEPVYGGLIDCDAYVAAQAESVRGEIASPAWKNAPWRVAVMHIPPFCHDANRDGWHGPARLRRELGKIFAEAGIDLMICGHTHCRALFPAAAGTHPYPIFIGGGPSEKSAVAALLRASKTRLRLDAVELAGRLPGLSLRLSR